MARSGEDTTTRLRWPHAEQENVTIFASEVGEVAVVEVIANLEPVAKNGDGNRTRWELETLATKFRDEDSEKNGEEEGWEEFF